MPNLSSALSLLIPQYNIGRGLTSSFENQGFDLGMQPRLPKDTSITREAKGSNINQAAQAAADFEVRNQSRLLTNMLRQRDVELGSTGMFTSGERIRRGDVLREQSSRSLADALARIGLQREGLRQNFQFQTTQQQFQIAQAEEQARRQEMALYASVVANLFGTGTDLYSAQQQGQQNEAQNAQLMQLMTTLGVGG